MKKLSFMACAALLASAAIFTGCKKDEPKDPQAQDKNSVKTEFTIAIPSQAASGAKRMPSATVPETGQFKGMKHITLIPFAKAGAVENSDKRLGSSNIKKITDIAADGLTTGGNAKRYVDISIPLTTSAFLVYAEATAAKASGDTDADKHQGGILAATDTALATTNSPADIHFDLVPILGSFGSIYSDTKAVNLLALLNAVESATDKNDKQWKNYVKGTDDAGMVAMDSTFRTMHALSSYEVKRVLEDLYKSVEPLKNASDPVDTLAAHIQKAIETGLTVTREGGVPTGAITGFAWKDGYDGYPANLNIPDGSVRIKYTTSFVACAEADYNSETQTKPTLFTYPSSLWYYANSTIKTANKSMQSSLEANKAWSAIITDYANEGKAAAVNSLTRSVAIENPIQYAVGRLDVQVKLGAGDIKDKINQNVTFNGTSFPISAVLIGNQRQVLFDFTPTTDGGATKYTIYDNAMPSALYATSAAFCDANSTLVLETPAKAGEGATDDNADVQIAIELTNNSTSGDFIGANGQLIPAGSKFYLVATLHSNAATETDKKVFKKDYLTKAKLTITSLANAYNEIPDLRTPQVELGMSVDLTWEAGHTYEIDL